MKWITTPALVTWADTIDAETEFPGLIGSLVRASVADIESFRFPSGENGRVRGYDGWLECAGAKPYVPAGQSLWEFGSGDSPGKAKGDYDKRVAEVDAAKRAQTTFVFVTPRAWNHPTLKLQDWVDERRQEKNWANVECIDGAQLETWLEEHPAVAALYARKVLGNVPAVGAVSTEEYWTEYASRFKPALTEDVLLCGREDHAKRLVQSFLGAPSSMVLGADSPDEVTAFAVAAIRKADPRIANFLESRTLVVHTEDAARFLAGMTGLVFLPRGQATQLAGKLGYAGPTLAGVGRDHPKRNHDSLPRPSRYQLSKAIQTMGLDEAKAVEYSRACGMSVTVLARMIPSSAPDIPDWADNGRIIPALLAGSWEGASDQDKELLSELASGRSYDDLEKDFLPLVKLRDPPIEREGTVWFMRAPVDAFVHLANLISEADLARLSAAAKKVFSQIEPPRDPKDLFRSSRQAPGGYSSWIRDGLATTLLHIAVLQDQAGLVIPGGTGQQFVDALVNSLPGLSADHRLLASLKGQLPLLAEAAPGPLLSALERLLEGDGAAIRPLFEEREDFITPSSDHTGLLWALETLAWDPMLLTRVTLVLGALHRIDPGGKLGNRPLQSLRAIFLSWSPNTNASLAQRLGAIDALIKRMPDAAWDLLVQLFPKLHDTSSPTSSPRFRHGDVLANEPMTYGLIWESQRAVVDRALTMVGHDAKRWTRVIDSLAYFEPPQRERALAQLDTMLGQASEDDRLALWKRLRDLVNQHAEFADADWAMKPEELAKFDDVIRRYEPTSVIERVAWLFDEWHPNIPGNTDHDEKVVAAARRDAIRGLMAERGLEGVLSLVERAALPHSVAGAFFEAADDQVVIEALIASYGRGDRFERFASSLSAGLFNRMGTPWIDRFRALVDEHAWEPRWIALLLIGCEDNRQTWQIAEAFGPQVDREYWQLKPSFLLRGSLADKCEALEKYLQHDRAVAALDAAHRDANKLPADLMFRTLDLALLELNKQGERVHNMFVFHLEQVLNALDARTDVDQEEIAKREYAYLPLIEHGRGAVSLQRLLGNSPELFISVICDVFKPDTGEAEPISEDRKTRARAGYSLLRGLSTLPGQQGDQVNPDILRAWVDEVRRRAREVHRLAITDQYIGHILAHSPIDPTDKAWPHRAARSLIDELHSEHLETGVSVERHNMRGVVRKEVYEGGDQERALAATYRQWTAASASWPRTAALLMRMAQGWDHEAEREDLRARQNKIRD